MTDYNFSKNAPDRRRAAADDARPARSSNLVAGSLSGPATRLPGPLKHQLALARQARAARAALRLAYAKEWAKQPKERTRGLITREALRRAVDKQVRGEYPWPLPETELRKHSLSAAGAGILDPLDGSYIPAIALLGMAAHGRTRVGPGWHSIADGLGVMSPLIRDGRIRGCQEAEWWELVVNRALALGPQDWTAPEGTQDRERDKHEGAVLRREKNASIIREVALPRRERPTYKQLAELYEVSERQIRKLNAERKRMLDLETINARFDQLEEKVHRQHEETVSILLTVAGDPVSEAEMALEEEEEARQD